MVVTMAPPPLITTTMTAEPLACCPSCGGDSLENTQAELQQAQARIAELESQVRLLNQKAAAAVDRWADYEDELSKLRAQAVPPPPPPKTEAAPIVSPSRASFLQSGTNRISQLLSISKTSPTLQAPRPLARRNNSVPVPAPSPSPLPHADLMEAFAREQSLRKEAETQLKDTSKEVEELSVTLFEQANNMVADERRARAKLEERVGELERRDREKRSRLEKLETAMARIERVRRVLDEPRIVIEPSIEVQEPSVHGDEDDDDETYENY